MTKKPLLSVLPGLEVPAELKGLEDRIAVERVVLTHDRASYEIHLISGVLLSRRSIHRLEAAVKKQFFGRQEVSIRILERFELEPSPLSALWEEYRESLFLDARERSFLEYNLLQLARLTFSEEAEGDRLELSVPRSLVNERLAQDLCVALRETFRERFGRAVAVDARFEEEAQKTRNEMRAETAVPAEEPAAAGPFPEEFPELPPFPESFEEAPAQPAEDPDLMVVERPVRVAGPKAGTPKKKYSRGKKLSPEEGWGRDFTGTPVPLVQIREEMGSVVVHGETAGTEERTLQTGKILFSTVLTDRTDSIVLKVFADPEDAPEVRKLLGKRGTPLLVSGETIHDTFLRELTIQHVKGIKKLPKQEDPRRDTEPEKRIELHCHTKMSEMDGVSDVKDIIRRAADFGHPAIAVTDHGVVYAFPEAAHAGKDHHIKVLYGCEGYLVDDRDTDDPEEIKRRPYYHICLLAQNETGRINLYRIVSESHLKYFYKRPRIPRSLLERYREGILVGSACERGEVFSGIVAEVSEEEMAFRVRFYDYLEIQPLGNNAFYLRTPPKYCKKQSGITEEDLKDWNRKVLEYGERFGKPVVATGDVHFLEPEDEIYRRIIMKGKGFKDADLQPPLYLHTTDEMLAEFAYLGEEKARKVVITNTHLIADCIDDFEPVRPDKCPPVIEGADEDLRTICYNKAHEIYGDPLPPAVATRLEKELSSIIGNGYAVMYVFAQKVIAKSNEEGYPVGSRGSVGSSLAAAMAGISEVNPLPPHYVCPACRYSDFDSDEVRAYRGKAGVDMPDRTCPRCGTKLDKLGFDIPFETFLGFHGEKEPDIDLNFSGEFQAEAHAYTQALFGDGYTFKAGTISGLADKNARGYVYRYFEEKQERKRNCELDRLAHGCEGVRVTTGQHPGGIVVMPHGESIYSFTPIQNPANKPEKGWVTTHFGYHSIEQNLLKFDLLGHDNPTMIKKLCGLTGLSVDDIPLDDPAVMQLFTGTESIGLTPADIGGTPLGTLGIPEFGTDNAIGMLLDAKPKLVSDLVRISGLAHGTDVWAGNAQDLILSGKATIQTAICTRDDIMEYLINVGLEPAESFEIMEAVRKGKVARGGAKKWPKWRQDMEEHGVPDWYIGSCEKIQYMFPRAHAAAYVTMALRIAYFKVHYPLAFYAAYFGTRGDGFDYEKMCFGPERVEQHIAHYRENFRNLTATEKVVLRDLRVTQEMYARGFGFVPLDLDTADALEYRIVDGKIMPAFSSIEGMGDIAARSIVQARQDGPFLSREDFVSRTKVNSSIADRMAEMGIFGDLPESNQISLFDIELG